jgi:hypothetical protein
MVNTFYIRTHSVYENSFHRLCRLENVFKIVPVQVPTKLEMRKNYVAFVFVITYVLQTMWRSYSNNRP